ncbi:MAG: hypothetical protein AAFW89_05785 [Bacteroidota bacterium]
MWWPVTHGPGEVAPKRPEVTILFKPDPIEFGEYILKPKAEIKGKFRVLKKRRYYFDEYVSLAPVDVLIGWGEMSDERNLNFLYFEADDRTYDINITRPPIPIERIRKQTLLFHFIPSNNDIDQKIKHLREGQAMNIEAYIVDVDQENGLQWNSSEISAARKDYSNLILWVKKIHD